MTLKDAVHALFRSSGYDLVRFDGRKFPERRRAELMQELGINVVIDIGAFLGVYIDEIRHHGFDGPIVAFEPLSGPVQRLTAMAAEDRGLTVHGCALGAGQGAATINVSKNMYSSSLLPMEDAHLRVAPDSAYVSEEQVQVRTLDSFGLVGPDDKAWLKIDTQGYEEPVLHGADHTLRFASAVEIELSFVELYTGQSLAWDLHKTLKSYGLELAGFGRPLHDPATSTLLQVDAVFLRPSAKVPKT